MGKRPTWPGATSAATVEARVGESQVLVASGEAWSRGVGASLVTPAFQVALPTFFRSIQASTDCPTADRERRLVRGGERLGDELPRVLRQR